MDYSAAMLEHARAGLAAHAEQLSWAIGDLSGPGWERDLQGPFDAVVSAAVLHNLREGARIRAIYGEIAKVLRAGRGVLKPRPCQPGRPAHRGAIRGHARRRAPWGREPPGCSPSARHVHSEAEAAAPATPRWQRFPADLPSDLAWLKEAGFAEVDCFSKEFQRTLFGGYMPGRLRREAPSPTHGRASAGSARRAYRAGERRSALHQVDARRVERGDRRRGRGRRGPLEHPASRRVLGAAPRCLCAWRSRDSETCHTDRSVPRGLAQYRHPG